MSNEPKHAEPVHDPAHDHEDDLIVVPKGQSRLRFYLTLSLLIFVLLIFTVGPFFEQAAANMFGGGGAKDVTLSWVHPGTGERIEYDDLSFRLAKRDLDLAAGFGLYSAPSVRTERGQLSDEDTAMYLVLQRMARDAGIAAGRKETLELLRQVFGSSQILAAQAARYNRTPKQVQDIVAEVMAVEKYKGLLLGAASIPDPAAVEELWAEEHLEYAFQYVAADVEAFREAAAAETPSDEELLTWYRELPMFEQRAYYTAERFRARVAWLPFGGEADGAALLERYPLPEDWDAETEARNYYNEVVRVRFTEERVVEEEDSSGDEDGGGEEDSSEEAEEPRTEQVTLPFEEVQEAALAEAPLRAALRSWLVDMRERTAAGDEVDFAAEAAELGLSFDAGEEPRTRAELQEAEGWGGPFIAGSLAFATPDSFLSNVTVEAGGIVVARLDEKVPGAEPPLDEMREGLVEKWAGQRAAELALETLEGLYAALVPEQGEEGQDTEEGEEESVEEAAEETPADTVVDEAAFRAAVEAAGLEVLERPYLERTELTAGEPEDATPGDRYIRSTASLYELEPGALAAPGKNAQNTHAFLVRLVGERPAPVDKMRPRDLMTLRQRVASEAGQDFEQRILSADGDWARNHFQIQMRHWDAD